MITKDLNEYAQSNWSQYLAPITEISKSDKGTPLVQSPAQIYNFDEVCRSLFETGKAPTSADGLAVTAKSVELVEFKSGFKQRITKQNLDREKARCKAADKVCEDYWELFFRNQKTNIHVLISSIRFKALESYITLEKQVLPKCSDTDTHIPLKLIVVIDEDEVDSIENTLAELAGKTEVADNHFSAVRNALRRLINQRDANGDPYFYDSIEVLSAQDYLNKVKLMA